MKKTNCAKKRNIVAVRKKCKAKGTGLSHYVMNKE